MNKSHTYFWGIAATFCLFLSVYITSIWMDATVNYNIPQQPLNNKEEINLLVDTYAKDKAIHHGKQYIVPAGFFIQSLKFINSSDVNITGYVWQKYPNDLPEDILRGITFPEQVASTNTVIKEEYEEEHNDYLLKGYYFDVTVRQPFNYKKFPLDQKSIWIRIWPRDWSNKIIFIPDLDSYDFLGSGHIFGMDEHTVAGPWRIFETHFSFNKINYDTNFGSDYQTKSTDIELNFNIIVGRKFMNAFVIHLVPLIIVLAMLFSILMMTTKESDRKDIFGSSTSGSLGATVALFFVTTLAHANIREQFAGAGLVYLESFYFIAYIMILLVSINTYHFTSTNSNLFLYRNDNLLPKVFYWPIILILALAVTLYYF